MSQVMSEALRKFFKLRNDDLNAAKHLRLGQHFCNLFIKEPWPELYYECESVQAAALIERWLADHHYTDELPPAINRIHSPH